MVHKLRINATYTNPSEFQNLLGPWEFARRDFVTFLFTLTNIGETTFTGQLKEFECTFGNTALGAGSQILKQLEDRIDLLQVNETRPLYQIQYIVPEEGQGWLKCKLESDDRQNIEYSPIMHNLMWVQGFTIVNREQLATLKLLTEIRDKIGST